MKFLLVILVGVLTILAVSAAASKAKPKFPSAQCYRHPKHGVYCTMIFRPPNKNSNAICKCSREYLKGRVKAVCECVTSDV